MVSGEHGLYLDKSTFKPRAKPSWHIYVFIYRPMQPCHASGLNARDVAAPCPRQLGLHGSGLLSASEECGAAEGGHCGNKTKGAVSLL